MKSRLVASIALSALVVAGATGCTFITPQASTIPYSPSDGVNIADSEGPIEIRNAMVIATEDGSTGNLVAALVNPTLADETLTVEVAGLEPLVVIVPANDTVSLGTNADPLRIDGLDTIPGATVDIYFQSGAGNGSAGEVPVLDGTLPYYSDLVPQESVVEDVTLTEETAG
ncbi:MAG: DNA modification methylase [Actinomycetota bacterium]